MKRRLSWLIACLLAWPAFAAGPGAVRKQVEASMVVTGTILADADGRVGGYTMDHADKLPKEVTRLLARTVPHWKFEPVLVDGKPAPAEAAMSLLVVARKLGKDNYLIKIRSANFGKIHGEDPDEPTPHQASASTRMAPPAYPSSAAYAGVTGTVYLIVRVAPDGHVQDAIAEQVNLRVIASESQMQKWREVFARSALRATERWVFAPPSGEKVKATGYESMRIPVDYRLEDRPPAYGEWSVYVPGPRQTPPWPEAEASPSPDALAAGGVYALTQALRLLTPLG